MVLRKYNIPDADMFQDSRTVRAQFLLDKAAYLAKNPKLADPFAADWLASIEASEGYETDETREDQQQQETEDVVLVMATARHAITDAFFYVDGAITSPSARNKFGEDNYGDASQSQAQMAVFLKNLHKQCEIADNKTLLLAAGYSQVEIDNLLVLHNSLVTENTEQDLMIKGRPSATVGRLTQYNGTFDFWREVNRTSKVVWYGNIEKLNEMKLPEGSESATNLRGEVKDGSNGNAPLKLVAVKIVELNLIDLTNSNGRFRFVAVPAGTYTLEFTLAGYTTVSQTVVVTQSGIISSNTVLTVV